MTGTASRRPHPSAGRLLFFFLAAVLTLTGFSGKASAATWSTRQTRVGVTAPAMTTPVGPAADIRAGQGLGEALPQPSVAQGHGVHTFYVMAGDGAAAGTAVLVHNAGGACPVAVAVGQAGEAAVRGAYSIGPKATISINGRTRILGGLTSRAVSEVKNVGYQGFTQQLKDYLAYAQKSGLRFDLYVRGGSNPTTLSGPLQSAIKSGRINLRFVP